MLLMSLRSSMVGMRQLQDKRRKTTSPPWLQCSKYCWAWHHLFADAQIDHVAGTAQAATRTRRSTPMRRRLRLQPSTTATAESSLMRESDLIRLKLRF